MEPIPRKIKEPGILYFLFHVHVLADLQCKMLDKIMKPLDPSPRLSEMFKRTQPEQTDRN
jgi:hypothetical protein